MDAIIAMSIEGTNWALGAGKRTCNTEAAALDEGASNGKNLLGKERNVECLRDGRGTRENVQYGLVARFDRHDGSGGSQDARVPYQVRSTKVRANADVFYDPCGRQHGLDVNEDAREIERATRRRFHTERSKDALRARCQKMKGRMETLMGGDNECIPR